MKEMISFVLKTVTAHRGKHAFLAIFVSISYPLL